MAFAGPVVNQLHNAKYCFGTGWSCFEKDPLIGCSSAGIHEVFLGSAATT